MNIGKGKPKLFCLDQLRKMQKDCEISDGL